MKPAAATPEWTKEAIHVAQYLAGNPNGTTTMTIADYRSLMLNTDGRIMACGRLYDIESKSMGAGVFRVHLRLTNP